MRAVTVLVGCLLLAAASLALPAAPSYDAWSWLLWGREVTRLELSTTDGPAFKPLTVALAALIAPAGSAAPMFWLLLGRVAALAGLVLAYLVGRDLAPANRRVAGIAAAVALLLTGGYAARAMTGDSEPLLVALALAAVHRAVRDRHGQALALAAAACLVRVEAWPFALVYAGWCAWHEPRLRPVIATAAVAVPAAWFVPEWLGSGDPLRSGSRALVPNPGAPALAEIPALASVLQAGTLLPLVALVGVAALLHGARDATARPALLPAAAGVAWIALVAVMAQAGFSGEPRYALPGAAAIALSGGIGLARLGSSAPALLVSVLALALAADGVRAVHAAKAIHAAGTKDRALAATLDDAIEAAGGRDRLLRCGRPAVGRRRGPMTAYALDVPKQTVRADGRPAAVTLRSRLRDEPLSPPSPPGAAVLARSSRWAVAARCGRP